MGGNSPSSFFLLHGLRSLAGGNLDAALHRLGRCRALLLEELAEAEDRVASSTAADPQAAAAAARAAACRLGAVCGSLGDCWRRRGELASAEEELKSSAGHLRRHASVDAEAAHTLSVTLSKLGDLEYYKQQAPQQQHEQQQGTVGEQLVRQMATSCGLGEGGGPGRAAEQQPGAPTGVSAAASAALPLYQEALELRRALCGPLSGGQAGPAAVLDLASALAKVADAHEVLGDAAAAQRCWRQAAAELHELKLQAGGALEGGPHDPLAAKLHMLEQLLALRGHAQPGQL